MNDKVRFLQKVNIGGMGQCWLWTATTTEKGYGRFRFRGKLRAAHRVAYQLFIGEIPDGMEVCHVCDVRGCVNPNHLFVGTHKQNQEDKARKGRTMAGPYKKHDAEIIKRALSEYVPYVVTFKMLSAKYGISEGHLRKVANGKMRPDINWRPMPQPPAESEEEG